MPKSRHKGGGGAFTVLMAFLVSLLTLRLVYNLLALSGGVLRQAVPAPPDPFDVVYILHQLEEETAASMGWGPGEEEETRKGEVERVSIHDLMVLKELNERKERLAITKAAEEREKAARVAEERGIAGADAERKGVGGSGKGPEAGVGKTGEGKKGRYFGWLDKGGKEVVWEAPAFSEQTHLRLRHGNASELRSRSPLRKKNAKRFEKVEGQSQSQPSLPDSVTGGIFCRLIGRKKLWV